ncbi:hypothetical protein CPB83DRAFT_894043 [Crepidotus variabilis]|uniref:Uncharacterized protein n=1 Tax=Crepidotus variabilis TaxID=179855 RepID=A0A9P6EFW5_9AGAR|nr:hypothetical protein CPB83DRAFT_894043 [Crepidotus variabilis]
MDAFTTISAILSISGGASQESACVTPIEQAATEVPEMVDFEKNGTCTRIPLVLSTVLSFNHLTSITPTPWTDLKAIPHDTDT